MIRPDVVWGVRVFEFELNKYRIPLCAYLFIAIVYTISGVRKVSTEIFGIGRRCGRGRGRMYEPGLL